MNDRSISEQILKYLEDVHSIEKQALPQVKAAPGMLKGAPALKDAFERHIGETESQERRVRARLDELGGSPSKLKDIAGTVTAPAFVLFAKSQPDTPGKLVTHAYSYEHMELAAYELLSRVAERGHDQGTTDLAREIAAEERGMAERIAGNWDEAVEAALQSVEPDDLGEQLNRYLADAHAIESQSHQMLTKAKEIGGDPELERIYAHHLEETLGQRRRLEERLEARDAEPNAVKDAAMRLGALNWGAFFAAQPDTPAKLAGFAYAFEHLEIGAYEQLRRVAQRAGDEESARTADAILAEERSASETLFGDFDRAVEASLESLGVTA